MSKSGAVWTVQQYEDWCRSHGVVPEVEVKSSIRSAGKAGPKRGRKKTQAESEYELILRLAHPDSKVLYEAYTLKLAPDTRYTPDLAVVEPYIQVITGNTGPSRIDFYEVKGRYIFAKALNKPKIAAAMFPHHRFFLASKTANGWSVKQLMPE